MPASALALVSLSLLLAAKPTTRDSYAERDKSAKKACAAGDFKEGVEILAGLYVDTDDPTYVYNQGRCYQQNHQWTSAIDRFREYLRKRPKAGAAEKRDVESHIAECEALREKDAAIATPGLLPLEPVQSASHPVMPPAVSVVPAVASTAPLAADRGSSLRLAAVIVGSVGVATAVTGLVLNLKANSLADDFNRTQDPETEDSQSSYKTGSMVCYAAGAGAAVTGIVLYLLGRSNRASATAGAPVSLMPVWTPAGVSVGMRGRF